MSNYNGECYRRNKKQDWARNIKKKFGIDVGQYNVLLESQNGACAICDEKMGHVMMAVDHDHQNGKIRGLLCRNCNTGLGQFQENIDKMNKAIEYLKHE